MYFPSVDLELFILAYFWLLMCYMAYYFQPFVDVCLKHGNKYEAQKYLPKVKDELKVKYYVKAG
jgi:hypothetical protein